MMRWAGRRKLSKGLLFGGEVDVQKHDFGEE
jgi:hypothetical protein